MLRFDHPTHCKLVVHPRPLPAFCAQKIQNKTNKHYVDTGPEFIINCIFILELKIFLGDSLGLLKDAQYFSFLYLQKALFVI